MRRKCINRDTLRGRINDLLDRRKDVYPTPKRIERTLRRSSVMISEAVIRDAISNEELEELQEKRIRAWKPEKLLFEFRSLTFAHSTERIDFVLNERLGKIITDAIRKDDGNWNCIDELGFSPGSWKKFLEKIPGIEVALGERGIDCREFMTMIHRKANERKKMGEN